jgi:enoyl-CoA hydratase/carnithine racemase
MENIAYKEQDGVATLTLNRPEVKNAITHEMWEQVDDLFVKFESGDARVLVITGGSEAFCSGADLRDQARVRMDPLLRMRRISEVALRLHGLSKPTIAKVQGVAAGAGCNLAFGCDFVIASEDASFVEIFSKRALTIDFGGSFLLPRLVGLQKAKKLAYFAERIGAKEACSMGLVTEVVSPSEIDQVTANWAIRLRDMPPLALSLTKRLLNDSYNLSMEQALERETQAQVIASSSEDAKEALYAFRERREAKFWP